MAYTSESKHRARLSSAALDRTTASSAWPIRSGRASVSCAYSEDNSAARALLAALLSICRSREPVGPLSSNVSETRRSASVGLSTASQIGRAHAALGSNASTGRDTEAQGMAGRLALPALLAKEPPAWRMSSSRNAISGDGRRFPLRKYDRCPGLHGTSRASSRTPVAWASISRLSISLKSLMPHAPIAARLLAVACCLSACQCNAFRLPAAPSSLSVCTIPSTPRQDRQV